MSPNNGSCFASPADTLPAKGDIVANRPNQKLRLLFLLKILMEKTDSTHGLTTQQIIVLITPTCLQISLVPLFPGMRYG